MTAFDLCKIYSGESFKLKRGRVVWESIRYTGKKCYVQWFEEIKINNQTKLMIVDGWIRPDAEIKIVT